MIAPLLDFQRLFARRLSGTRLQRFKSPAVVRSQLPRSSDNGTLLSCSHTYWLIACNLITEASQCTFSAYSYPVPRERCLNLTMHVANCAELGPSWNSLRGECPATWELLPWTSSCRRLGRLILTSVPSCCCLRRLLLLAVRPIRVVVRRCLLPHSRLSRCCLRRMLSTEPTSRRAVPPNMHPTCDERNVHV